MRFIKHIWKYLTDKDYRFKMTLLDLNRKYVKSHKKRLEELYREQPVHTDE
jgi:hypothetical protein